VRLYRDTSDNEVEMSKTATRDEVLVTLVFSGTDNNWDAGVVMAAVDKQLEQIGYVDE
jgi:hypothetical protein